MNGRDMRKTVSNVWFWGRVALLLVLAGHAVWYAKEAAEEQRVIRTELLPRIPADIGARARIEATNRLAFELPPHRGVDTDYGLRHPLMKLLRPSALQVFEHGGHCAKRARLLVVLLEEQGIPARKLFLYNERGLELLHDPPRAWVHVAVEAQLDDRWVVVDPLFGIVMQRADGRAATVAELQADPGLVRANRLRADERYDVWEDSLYTYADVRRFPWFMIPVVGEKKYDLLAGWFGKEWADGVTTPLWLEQPQTAIVIFSVLFAGLIGLTFVRWRRPIERRRFPRD